MFDVQKPTVEFHSLRYSDHSAGKLLVFGLRLQDLIPELSAFSPFRYYCTLQKKTINKKDTNRKLQRNTHNFLNNCTKVCIHDRFCKLSIIIDY